MQDISNIQVNTQSSIRIAGSSILYFDPLNIEGEPHDADIVFITHEHYDHFSPDDIDRVSNDTTKIICPATMKDKLLSETGFFENQVFGLKPLQKKEARHLFIDAVIAYNTTKPFHKKKSEWLGYVVTMDNTRYYISGDSDATPELKSIRCDIAFLPIGGTYTMDYKEAARATSIIGPRVVIPTHYGDQVGSPDDGAAFKALIPKNIDVALLLQFD